MPNLSRVDYSDLADDDVKSLEDLKIRDVIYRVTEKIKSVFEYQESLITTLTTRVATLEDEIAVLQAAP